MGSAQIMDCYRYERGTSHRGTHYYGSYLMMARMSAIAVIGYNVYCVDSKCVRVF